MNRSMKTMDGNSAAAHVAYAYTDVAAIYPITPSSVMAELTDEWSVAGRNNLFGEPVRVIEMQSEGGVAGTVHGSLAAGALTTTFTASQGLLLMIPNMYKMAGELLPCVIHCSARALATHALSIFGDHSDIYACRQTGFAMLCSSSVQEVMDLAPVAHLAAIKRRIPFLHFFDGFRTSHEIQKIEVWNDEQLESLMDRAAVDTFRYRGLSPNRPVLRGSAQNPDIFFQEREVANQFYDTLPRVVEEYMNKINAMIGSDYHLFDYYGDPDAEQVIVAMGSVCQTIEEVIDHKLVRGEKVGLIKVRLYRPFSREHLLRALPDTVKSITVLDRTKEPGSIGEPLYLDVVAALQGSRFQNVPVYTGRYGLGSKDVTPGQIFAVYRNAKTGQKPRFTIGITDDVTYLSLLETDTPDTTPNSTYCCKFWGLGSDGTVGANKNSIKIIGDHTDKYVQAYFQYDSKKTGGVTISHLRFGDKPIKSPYYINKADFVACHNPSYITKGFPIVRDVKPGGVFMINCQWTPEELAHHLDAASKRYIAENNIQLYTIDAIDLAQKIGMGKRTNTILQSAFFSLAKVLPEEDAIKYMKEKATQSYSKKGMDIVEMNHKAIDAGATAYVKVDVPADWANAEDVVTEHNLEGKPELVKQVKNILFPVDKMDGDSLPVSTFVDHVDGQFELGAAAYEKRGVAVAVPEWDSKKCIQCGNCAYVCPHATIRTVALTDEEAKNAPAAAKIVPVKAGKGKGVYQFTMAISPLDCMGCGVCVGACPEKVQAIKMVPQETQLDQQEVFDYCVAKVADKKELQTPDVKGSQFRKPLLEFSGSCAGCAETSYARLVTQLFGDKMYISNATGCSSIWGNPGATNPYCTNAEGKGPAWCNSLFEDNAEHGFGMYLGQKAIRDSLIEKTKALIAVEWTNADLKAAAQKYLDTVNDLEANAEATKAYVAALEENVTTVDELAANEKFAAHAAELKAKGEKYCDCDACALGADILSKKDYLSKKSVWIFGGDGWAYDIGFGGVDHVLASGEDVNIFVFDTEVYSNTGGQASKASNIGQVAQFAAAGKETKSKSLAEIAMSYGYVYVAQVAMGANAAQTLKAIQEAEAYHGPSLIIGYAPCEMHSIKGGMQNCQKEMKKAVDCGYWNMFRFNPAAEKKFTLDSKAPAGGYQEFLMNEARYSRLTREFPERATVLFAKNEENAKERYEHLLKLVDMYDK